ncbi:LptF/LptG family permease [Pedobacter sp. UC225_65]|uniref:LptF/LptG family permease n=1 Tax=Pedobacter sp. UC225_65 TaxID=3350173 RepID=UPI00366B2486
MHLCLTVKDWIRRQDSLSKNLDSVNRSTKINVGSYYKTTNYVKGYTKVKSDVKTIKGSILNLIPKKERTQVIQNAAELTASIKQVVNNRILGYQDEKKEIIGARVEYLRKYTLAFSCLLLFFIGAPLGAIIRKGGLGLPVVIAVVFFLVYHIISTVAEKSAKEGTLEPVFGMWMAIIVLTPLGIFLTYKATVDSALFDVDYYKQVILGLFKRKKLNTTN